MLKLVLVLYGQDMRSVSKRFGGILVKKIIAIAVSLVVVIGTAFVGGLVGLDVLGIKANAVSESNLTFTLINNGSEYELIGCAESATGALTVPSAHNGKSVTSIRSNAFDGCDSLTSISIPESITSIGSDMFSGCSKLASIDVDPHNTDYSSQGGVLFNKYRTKLIACPKGMSGSYKVPYGVTAIADNAFRECEDITSVSFLSGVTSIGSNAFEFCKSIKSITLPDSLTDIGDNAFTGCDSLMAIDIPAGVESIGNGAFGECDALAEICVDELNKYYSSDDGVLFNKAKTQLIRCPAAKTGCYTVPAGVKAIGDGAFSCCAGLESVTMSDGVESIGVNAFSWCEALTSIYLSKNVTSIGSYAFYRCNRLESVNLPYGTASIGEWAFSHCTSLTDITVPDSVVIIGNYAFDDCKSLNNL